MRNVSLLIGIGLLILSPAFASGNPGNGNGNGNGGGTGSPIGCGGLANVVAGLPYEDVDATEAADLVFMREEEKLARDIYQAMDDLWGLRAFGQIMWSEQVHMDAVLAVLDKYEIGDPVGANPPGIFTDPGLQQVFDDLLAQGNVSLVEALTVGATIEDLDIRDLQDTLARTDNEDIKVVYQNLMKGSRNHMRSFYTLLQANGVTYEAQYLTPAELDAIVTSPHEHGMVDADGEPVFCGGGGGGGQGPGHGPRHQRHHQQQNQSGMTQRQGAD